MANMTDTIDEERFKQQGKKESSPKADAKGQQQTVCEECKENPSKYKCPGCSFCSCSLPCVKAHKHRTGCSGERNRTQFVPLSQFNDNLLLSDYNLLEEMKRVTESAQRMRSQLRAYPQFRLPVHLQSLRHTAGTRGTKLLLLPSGMSKRESNRTQYMRSKKIISWTIAWRFHTIDVVLFDHGVHEDTNLSCVFENHLKTGPWKHQLKQFCEENLASLKFFIRKDPKGLKSPFRKLDINAPLRQQLVNVTVLEYPVIHVFLPSHSYNFEVVEDINPTTQRPETNNYVENENLSPKGVAFKEEEIEDDNCLSDPQVFDFIKNVTLSPLHCDIFEKTCDSPLLRSFGAANNLDYNSRIIEPSLFEGMDFDFDQGLMDAYADLVGEINTDDFLNLEGDLSKEEKDDFLNSGHDELEEGEIAE